MSEPPGPAGSQEMLPAHGSSKVFICSDVSKSGSSLCVSMDFGLAGAPTPIMERDEVKDSLNTPILKVCATYLLTYLLFLLIRMEETRGNYRNFL